MNPLDVFSGAIDIRGRIAAVCAAKIETMPKVGRGPYERIPLRDKRGLVVHYRGVTTPATMGFASYEADARYHVGKDFGSNDYGSTIMYHVGVDGEGKVYILNDLDRVLWHCGAWPQNANTLAVQLPMGGDQRATAPQLAGLKRVADQWLAVTKASRAEVWGHKHLSQTPCPGTLMSDFVNPYRVAVPLVAPARLEGTRPAVDPNSVLHPTGHHVINGVHGDGRPVRMKALWEAKGGVAVCGYALTGMEFDWATKCYRQLFENVLLELWMDNFGSIPGPYGRFGGLGQRYVKLNGWTLH